MGVDIQGIPDKIQFAKDGKYEVAWVIDINDARPTEDQLQGYLAREEFNELVVEYIWRSNDGENANVVTIGHNNNLLAKNPIDFMNLSLDAFYGYRNFNDFVIFVDKRIIGFDFLFKTPVDAIRIGVLNHWFSVGPVDLWRRGEVVPTLDTVRTKISTNPKLSPTILNYQALAFIFNLDRKLRGPYHVIKAPAAQKTAAGWEIDYEKTYGYINKWLAVLNKTK
jgi:hypothetical protein